MNSLAKAVDLATTCSIVKEIHVAEGTYYPGTSNNRDITLALSRSNLKIIGGFPTGGGDRNHRLHRTVLDGNIGNTEVATDNSYHIMAIVGVSGPDSLVVDGLVFQNARTEISLTPINIKGISVFRKHGGAIYIGNNSSETPILIRNCIFTENYSAEDGAAIYSTESVVTLHSCRFYHNEALGQAPGIYVYKGSMQIINSLFTKNIAGGEGGAVTFNQSEGSSLINTTFYKNTSLGGPGGAVNATQSELAIKSCIFNENRYGDANTDPLREKSDIEHHGNSELTVERSVLQSDIPTVDCENCPPAGTDPLFIDVSDATGRRLGLLAGSKAINRGDKNQLPSFITTDIEGVDRTRGAETDIGAFEAAPLTDPLERLYVKESLNTGFNNGYDWENAFYGTNGLGRALEYARNNSTVKEIWVAGGTYYPFSRPDNFDNTNPHDPHNSFLLVEGVKIYGGFAGNEENLSDRDWIANPTILSGDQNKDGQPSGEDAYHLVMSLNNTIETVLDGVTITGGYANGSLSATISGHEVFKFSGAGMYLAASSPAIRNCTFYQNVARGEGGGMAMWAGSTPTLEYLVFRQNSANNGGGLYSGLVSISAPPVEFKAKHIHFEENTATASLYDGGGAACISRSFISFENSVFTGNTAVRGGAIQVVNNSSNKNANYEVYANCLFVNNSASQGGGVYSFENGNEKGPQFLNCTFAGNTTANQEGGDILYVAYQSSPLFTYPTFYNSIIARAPGGNTLYGTNYTGANYYSLENCLTDYAFPGIMPERNIITSDFRFTNEALPAGPDGIFGTEDDGLIPLSDSPAQNNGLDKWVPEWLTTDFRGNPRIQGPFVDLGAYEHYELCEGENAALALYSGVITALPLTQEPADLLIPDNCKIMGILEPLNAELTQENSIHARLTITSSSETHEGRPYVRRYFDLMPVIDAETHEGYLTLYFTREDFLNYNSFRGEYTALPESASDATISNLRIWQWHGTSTEFTPGTYSKGGTLSEGILINPDDEDIQWNEDRKRWEIRFRFSGFSGFFVTSIHPTSLPVTLSDFSVSAIGGEAENRAALIKWSTTEEANTKEFVVENSTDSRIWKAIGSVVATGTSLTPRHYSLIDRQPQPGVNLYRLKSVDLDGSFTYSPIRSVRFTSEATVYPNPVKDRLFISRDDENPIEKVTVFDLSGRRLGQYLYSEEGISVNDLSPGVYQVILTDKAGTSESTRIVVVK